MSVPQFGEVATNKKRMKDNILTANKSLENRMEVLVKKTDYRSVIETLNSISNHLLTKHNCKMDKVMNL